MFYFIRFKNINVFYRLCNNMEGIRFFVCVKRVFIIILRRISGSIFCILKCVRVNIIELIIIEYYTGMYFVNDGRRKFRKIIFF